MFNFLKKFLDLRTIFRTALFIALSKVDQSLDEKGLDEAQRSLVDAVIQELVDEVTGEIDKL